MSNTLQKNIKKRLEKQNLSIAELERRTGLRHSVINIMHGRSKNPSAKIAHAIAKGLGCTIEELLEDYDLTNCNQNNNCINADHNNNNLEVNHLNHLNTENLLEKDFTPLKRDTPFESELASSTFASIQKFLRDHDLHPTMIEVMNCWLEIYNYCFGTKDKLVDERFIEWFMERNFLTPKQI